jgi:hypothetical protein
MKHGNATDSKRAAVEENDDYTPNNIDVWRWINESLSTFISLTKVYYDSFPGTVEQAFIIFCSIEVA